MKKSIFVGVLLASLSLLFLFSNAQSSRLNFNAPNEISGHIRFGGGFPDMSGYNSLKKALGKEPGTYLTYINVTNSSFSSVWKGGFFSAGILPAIQKLPAAVLPIVNISMIVAGQTGNARGKLTCAEFANTSKWDKNMTALIADLKSLNRPVLIAFGYEYDHANMGYITKDFKAAYKKFVTAYRAANAVKLSNIWVSAGMSSGRGIKEKMNWYPGDEWVDWWGYNLYSPDDEQRSITAGSPRLPAFCDSAVKHKKPVGIVESSAVGSYTVARGQYSVDKWFYPMFNLIYSLPAIKMWGYCNINWSTTPNTGSGYIGDSQVQNNSIVYSVFKQQMESDIWVFGDGVVQTYEQSTPLISMRE